MKTGLISKLITGLAFAGALAVPAAARANGDALELDFDRVLGSQAHVVLRPLEEANRPAIDDEGFARIIEPRAQRLRSIDQWETIARRHRNALTWRIVARVDGTLTGEDADAFREGIRLRDGTECLEAELNILAPDQALVTIHEGKYHQVKRMLASRGKPVVYLKRMKFGALELDPALGPGQWRELTENERKALVRADLSE